jgi:hypothetical protein
MGQPSIVSVQRTLQTAENGKFIFIVYTAGYNEAKDLIQEFCENKFKLIYITQQQRDDYRVSVKSHPHLVTAALPGGATAEHGKYLVEMLKQEESQKGKQYATTSAGTWASKVKPKFTFDPSSEHPNATIAKTTTTTAVVATGNGSIGSNNSSSTLAPTAPLNSSGQTVVSQDLSSIVSQMQSMQSEQSKALQSLIERQDKQARRQAKAQRKATAATVRANENMMSMVVEMFREMRGGKTNKKKSQKKKEKSTQDKKKKNKKKLVRDPKQNKRSHEDAATKTKQDASPTNDQDDRDNQEKAIVAYNATENKAEIKVSPNDDAPGAVGLNTQDEIELNPGDDDIGSAAYGDSDVDSANGSGKEDDYDTADEYDEEDDEDDDDDDDDESSDGSSGSDDESEDSSDDSTVTPPARNRKKKKSPRKESSTSEVPQVVVPTEVVPNESSPSAAEAPEGYHDAGRFDKYFTPATRVWRKKRMTTEEARKHTKESIAARKKELSARAERKIALRVPDPDQTPMATNATPSPGSTTPPSKRERTRQRSPGGTPDNDQKLQRTGTAPLQPSTNDEIARALDYLSHEEAITQEESMEPAGLAGQPI